MKMKWFFTLVSITALFLISGFFIDADLVFAYYWMTLGMSLVSFIYYYIVTSSNKKDSKKMIGGNLAAIVLKFILSGIVVILFIVFWGMNNPLNLAFFFIAYGIFSVVNYVFSYIYKND